MCFPNTFGLLIQISQDTVIFSSNKLVHINYFRVNPKTFNLNQANAILPLVREKALG